MIKADDLLEEVVRPVLAKLESVRPGMNSLKVERLLMGTAAQESDLGYFMKQHPRGPARGIWQMEEATVDDLQGRYLMKFRNLDLYTVVEGFATPDVKWYDQLSWNMRLACALARVRYWMVPVPVPEDLIGQARYWDLHYNANDKEETVEYIRSWEEFIAPEIQQCWPLPPRS